MYIIIFLAVIFLLQSASSYTMIVRKFNKDGGNIPLMSKQIVDSSFYKELLHTCNNHLYNELLRLRKTAKKYRKQLQQYGRSNSSEDVENFKKLIWAGEQESPLFLLNECMGKDCVLSRVNGYARVTYAQKVTRSVLKKIKDKEDGSIHYVTVGSGHLYPDYDIFRRILSEEPDAKVCIHAIDTEYSDSILILDTLKKGRCLSEQKNVIPEQVEEVMQDCIKKAHPSIPLEKVAAIPTYNFYSIRAMIHQYVNGLQTQHPNAQISLAIYRCLKDFLKNALDKLTTLDCVTAADIDNNSLYKEYIAFIKTIQMVNPTIKNVLLTEVNLDRAEVGYPYLLSLRKFKSDRRNNFVTYTINGDPYYCKVISLKNEMYQK